MLKNCNFISYVSYYRFSILIFRQELMTENGTDCVFYAKDELVFCKLINRNQAEVDLRKVHQCWIQTEKFGLVCRFFFTFFFLDIIFTIFFLGGKHSLPSGLPSQYYHGYVGCIKKVKVFRRKLDLLRQGDNSNLKLCDSWSIWRNFLPFFVKLTTDQRDGNNCKQCFGCELFFAKYYSTSSQIL